MRGIVWAAAVLPSMATFGDAAETVAKGVYLTSQELCEQARKETLQTVIEAGNVILSPRGLESLEYNCEFVEVVRAQRSPTWLVHAVCEEPGYIFPDVLTITERASGELEIVSVTPSDESGGGNSGTYYLCDGVPVP